MESLSNLPSVTQLESSRVLLSRQSQSSLPLHSRPAEFRLGADWRGPGSGQPEHKEQETATAVQVEGTGSPRGTARAAHALCGGMPG